MRLPLVPVLSAVLALGGLGAIPAPVAADDAPPAVPGTGGPRVAAEPRPVDLVVALDTSGSMEGLINAARQKIWSVVSEMASAKPTPRLRVALLTYGSPGDERAGYVVLQTDFTEDLDLVSERLFALTTNGGDEFVGRALSVALDRLSWDAREGLKVVFIAGNESADQDAVKPFRAEARRAAERGIHVDSIYCGGADDPDAGGWREVASLGRGRFAAIDQQSGVVAVPTPFDDELARLSGEINATYVAYGKRAKEGAARQEAQDSNAGAAGAPAAAERAAAKAGGLYRNAAWDLVDRMDEKDFDLAKVPVEDLPEAMRALTTIDARRAYLVERKAERIRLSERIRELDAKRQAFVTERMAAERLDDGKAFDRALKEAIREQAAASGFRFP